LKSLNAVNLTSGMLGTLISQCYGGRWPQYGSRALLEPYDVRMKEVSHAYSLKRIIPVARGGISISQLWQYL
jgi:hypothetical protein